MLSGILQIISAIHKSEIESTNVHEVRNELKHLKLPVILIITSIFIEYLSSF